MIKCELEGGEILKPCDGLNRAIRGYGDEIGVNIIAWSNIDTGKGTRTFCTYNPERGKKSKRYIMNFCPACGSEICPMSMREDDDICQPEGDEND